MGVRWVFLSFVISEYLCAGQVLFRKFSIPPLYIKQKVNKAIPATCLERPCEFQKDEAPRYQDNRHMKVERLSVLHTGRLYPPVNIRGNHFCYRMSLQRAHSEAERIISMNNSNDIIVNRNSDLPACSTVSQPTASPSILSSAHARLKFRIRVSFFVI